MNTQRASAARPDTALLLSGGGARAAYQAGVLQTLAELQRRHQPEVAGAPFDIIVGTSAGALNAAFVASQADAFGPAVKSLVQLWSQLHVQQIYHASTAQAVRASLRWLGMAVAGWTGRPRTVAQQPRSLLDNQPLRALLQEQLQLQRVPQLLARGQLRALAVTTSSYSTGEHITFFDGPPDMPDWTRERRRAVRTPICIDHLMASAAIPFLFPAVRIQAEGQVGYYGDGAMRQVAPIAPVVHLGAQRVLVIGVGRELEPSDSAALEPAYPSLAQVANHALSSIFFDTLAVDFERIERVNRMLALIDPAQRPRTGLRPIELLAITPSCRLDHIAARHTQRLPPALRLLLNSLGMRGGAPSARSSALAAYLLFEAGFAQELMALGQADAWLQQDEICRFFGWDATTAT